MATQGYISASHQNPGAANAQCPADIGRLVTVPHTTGFLGLSFRIFSEYPEGLARGSLLYCGQPVFELVACNMPPACCILFFEPPAQTIKKADTRMGICFFGGSPGARYNMVGNQFLNWWAATCHRHVAFNHSSPWQSKKRTPKRVSAFLVARQGLEPWTHALKGRCSTN